jgi:hypothetical protein
VAGRNLGFPASIKPLVYWMKTIDIFGGKYANGLTLIDLWVKETEQEGRGYHRDGSMNHLRQ